MRIELSCIILHNFVLICSTPDSAEESGDDLVFLPDVTFTDCNLIMNCDDTVIMTNCEAELSVDMECNDDDYENVKKRKQH